MRAAISLAMLALLAACDEAGPERSDPSREITAERVGAERACAEITGYKPDGPRETTPDTQLLFQKEYDACVAAVLAGDKPALRGRTEDASL